MSEMSGRVRVDSAKCRQTRHQGRVPPLWRIPNDLRELMAANVKEGVLQAFEILKEEEIAAPMSIVFETILEEMGPLNSTPEKPMPMVLEAWPGGRWYRDRRREQRRA